MHEQAETITKGIEDPDLKLQAQALCAAAQEISSTQLHAP